MWTTYPPCGKTQVMNISDSEKEKLWELVKYSLSKRFSPESYKAWIEHSAKLAVVEGDSVVVAVRNNLALQWLEKNAKEHLNTIFNDVLGVGKELSFSVDDKWFTKGIPIKETIPTVGNLLTSVEEKNTRIDLAIKKACLNEKYTFESFIVGTNNQIAHAAAMAVSQHSGENYNPLFIYGSVGVGKTHLMQAIGIEILRKDPNKKIFYCSSETFLNEMVESIRGKKNAEFREKYRKLDVLMIDDIQFISQWEGAQNELFHTFNMLHGANKQVLLASDRPPSQINNLADRLKSRFEGGMIIDILPADYETRFAILANFNKDHSPALSLESMETIAMMVEDNIRQLIGAYNKVFTYAQITKTQMDSATVEKILGGDRDAARKKVNVIDILQKVADSFGVTVGQIKSTSRSATIVLPRQIAMYLIREILDYPLEKTANVVKRNDHTTVIHAIEKVTKLMENDHLLRTQVVSIKNSVLK